MTFSEIVELRGHIIDSYALPQIMDEVMDRGGEFVIEEISVGRRKDEPSYARIQISAPDAEQLALLLHIVQRIRAVPCPRRSSRSTCCPLQPMGCSRRGFIRRPTSRRRFGWVVNGSASSGR